jgi:hypothetical protein
VRDSEVPSLQTFIVHNTPCISRRLQDMSVHGVCFSSMDDLETYAENSCSSTVYLALEALNIREDNMLMIASHVGVGAGIVALLRGIGHHSSQVIFVTV